MAFIPHGLVLICVASLLYQTSGIEIGHNTTEIQCEEGKEGCSDCYITLVKNVVYNDGNMFRLSQAFLPPTTEAPVFVKVNYIISNNETKEWFWTVETSSLLHPIQGNQFFSLFFGNYEWLAGEVDIMLPNDCSNVKMEAFTLLTQRLKQYVLSSGDIQPEIHEDDESNANSAANDAISLLRLHVDDGLAAALGIYHIFIPPFVAILTGLVIYSESVLKMIDRHLPKSEEHEKNARVFSTSILAIIIIIFACSMDIGGIIDLNTSDNNIFNITKGNTPLDAITKLPQFSLFFIDFILLGITVSIFVCYCTCSTKVNEIIKKITSCINGFYVEINDLNDTSALEAQDNNNQYSSSTESIIIATSIVSVSTMFSNHSYFIFLAFINDKAHANSVGIWYAILISVFFVSLKILWKADIRKLTTTRKGYNQVPSEKTTLTFSRCAVIHTIVMVIGVGLLEALVIFLFVYIPTKRSVEDIPQQINSVYSSLIALFTGLITYKLFFGMSADNDTQNPILWRTVVYENSEVKLTKADKYTILTGEWLNDKIVHASVLLLKKDHNDKYEFFAPLTTKNQGQKFQSQKGVAIMQTEGNHWVTIQYDTSTVLPTVTVYDSHSVSERISRNIEIRILDHLDKDEFTLKFANVEVHGRSPDCGILCIAFATALCNGKEAEKMKFDSEKIRRHLVDCTKSQEQKLELFPNTERNVQEMILEEKQVSR